MEYLFSFLEDLRYPYLFPIIFLMFSTSRVIYFGTLGIHSIEFKVSKNSQFSFNRMNLSTITYRDQGM